MGLYVPTVEVAQQVIFTVLFPITFVSNVFVPPQTPAGLAPADRGVEPDEHADRGAPRAVGQPEPVRLGQLPVPEPGPGDASSGSSSIVAIFGPLGVRRYRSMSR